AAQREEAIENVLDGEIGDGRGYDRNVILNIGQAVDAFRGRGGTINRPVGGQIDGARSYLKGFERLGFQVCASYHLSDGTGGSACSSELGFDLLRTSIGSTWLPVQDLLRRLCSRRRELLRLYRTP